MSSRTERLSGPLSGYSDISNSGLAVAPGKESDTVCNGFAPVTAQFPGNLLAIGQSLVVTDQGIGGDPADSGAGIGRGGHEVVLGNVVTFYRAPAVNSHHTVSIIDLVDPFLPSAVRPSRLTIDQCAIGDGADRRLGRVRRQPRQARIEAWMSQYASEHSRHWPLTSRLDEAYENYQNVSPVKEGEQFVPFCGPAAPALRLLEQYQRSSRDDVRPGLGECPECAPSRRLANGRVPVIHAIGYRADIERAGQSCTVGLKSGFPHMARGVQDEHTPERRRIPEVSQVPHDPGWLTDDWFDGPVTLQPCAEKISNPGWNACLRGRPHIANPLKFPEDLECLSLQPLGNARRKAIQSRIDGSQTRGRRHPSLQVGKEGVQLRQKVVYPGL